MCDCKNGRDSLPVSTLCFTSDVRSMPKAKTTKTA